MAESTAIHPAANGCIDACARCEQLLDMISEEMFVKSTSLHESIGAHLRHGLEHITCFLAGVDGGVIDYDLRQRSEALETNTAFFKNALHKTIQELCKIPLNRMLDEVKVRQIQNPGVPSVEMKTTVERELVFLSSHMVHHIAFVALICRHEGVDVPAEIGLAFSTAAYREAAAG